MIEKLFVYAGSVAVIVACVNFIRDLVHTLCYDIKHEQCRPFIENLVNYVIDLAFMILFSLLALGALIAVVCEIGG